MTSANIPNLPFIMHYISNVKNSMHSCQLHNSINKLSLITPEHFFDMYCWTCTQLINRSISTKLDYRVPYLITTLYSKRYMAMQNFSHTNNSVLLSFNNEKYQSPLVWYQYFVYILFKFSTKRRHNRLCLLSNLRYLSTD